MSGVFFLLHALILTSYASCESESESLGSVIRNKIEKAKKYVFPGDNKAIFENISENAVEEFGVYDFIVIGAGSTGSVLASRLSEVEEWKILLLEAGGDEDGFTDVPDMMFWSLFSERNWGYYTTPQTTCCQGMLQKRCFYPRGKNVGGTSSVNALMYVRGNPKDFDQWKKLGIKGWSYDDVLPYFKKSEHFSIPNQTSFHGYDGPVNVQYAQPISKFYHYYAKANEQLGINYTDYNGENQFGYSRVQFTQKNGKRLSAANTFLKTLGKNLHVSKNSFVTKIVFENDDAALKTKGVEFVKNGKVYLAVAKKEIIVSAGAINSPQILMLSGIGPEEELKSLDIPVRKNLPVGKTLKDHVNFFGMNFRTNLTETVYSEEEILQQYLKGEGDLTIPANDRAIGFYKIDPEQEVPDIEYILVPPSTNPFGTPSRRVMNLNDDLNDSYLSKIGETSDMKILLLFLHPKSEGSVTLKSKNPRDFPLIDMNHFSDEGNRDMEKMYESIRFILRLMDTEAFRKIEPRLTKIESCGKFDVQSKDYWFCALRTLATSSYHPTTTTRMGVSESDSVVDSKLRIHGVQGLRVADCGIIPATTSGHPHAVAMMIGEKLADILKEEYRS